MREDAPSINIKAISAALRFPLQKTAFWKQMQKGWSYVQGWFLSNDEKLHKTAGDSLVLVRCSGSRKLRNTDDLKRKQSPGPGGTSDPVSDGQSQRYVSK